MFLDENGHFCVDHYPDAFELLIKHIESETFISEEESQKEILQFEIEFWGLKKKIISSFLKRQTFEFKNLRKH